MKELKNKINIGDEVTPEWSKKSIYLKFIFADLSKSGKTNVYNITNKDGFQLGVIKFFPNFRKYSFFPANNIVLDPQCLKDIYDFLFEVEMKRRGYVKGNIAKMLVSMVREMTSKE